MCTKMLLATERETDSREVADLFHLVSHMCIASRWVAGESYKDMAEFDIVRGYVSFTDEEGGLDTAFLWHWKGEVKMNVK